MHTPSATQSIDTTARSPLVSDREQVTTFVAESNRGEGKRRNLVGLLRGYFASPVIAALGETGMAERMLAGDFSVTDWDAVSQPDVVAALFRYLLSIGLITKGTIADYALTSEGRTAVGRNGAFSLLMSYEDYFRQLPEILAGQKCHPSVNRLRNVRGSGQLHTKKFFPAALGFFSDFPPTAVIDVGCGDGRFLEHARQRWPNLPIFGVDLSETAVETTKDRLGSPTAFEQIAVASNGRDVKLWSQAAPENVRKSPRLIISLWFVAHEFSNGSAETIQTFFSVLHQTFPQAQIVLGEINKISPEILAEDHDLSIMPEFLLFHELSGQGVLSWGMWQNILESIPYDLKAECRFDEVRPSSGEMIPASFLWLLHPKPAISL